MGEIVRAKFVNNVTQTLKVLSEIKLSDQDRLNNMFNKNSSSSILQIKL